jgi:hypothetical protein
MAGRKNNAVKSQQLTVSVSVPVFNLLRGIAQTGFSARTESAVAEEMIRKGLNADGLLSEIVRKRVFKKATNGKAV